MNRRLKILTAIAIAEIMVLAVLLLPLIPTVPVKAQGINRVVISDKTCAETIINYPIQQNVEKEIPIPVNTIAFEVQCRGSNPLQMAIVSGQSNTTWWTIKSTYAWNSFYLPNYNYGDGDSSIFVMCTTADTQVVEFHAITKR